jgi:hypothetical protein
MICERLCKQRVSSIVRRRDALPLLWRFEAERLIPAIRFESFARTCACKYRIGTTIGNFRMCCNQATCTCGSCGLFAATPGFYSYRLSPGKPAGLGSLRSDRPASRGRSLRRFTENAAKATNSRVQGRDHPGYRLRLSHSLLRKLRPGGPELAFYGPYRRYRPLRLMAGLRSNQLQ